MSKEIDERIVSMQFDNRQFEKNVSTTMSTLEKLKQKLNFSGASRGLEEINTAAKRTDFSPMAKGVEAVQAKFTALEVMGVTALANLTNQAVNAGKRIASALTIDPVRTGFNEYELKMDSVKTIMASTGEELSTVNQYLEELNEYSDRTIYSFSDMTQNIGKFTNSGVKLEDAVLAIKGISNEAALSGANANEAARAMYNFAQALSVGYIQRIDWKSIELANMATMEFKEQLLGSAVALGTVRKNADGTYVAVNDKSKTAYNTAAMFTETLDEQWLTTEVLIDVLKDYADETTDIGKRAYAAAQDVTKFTQMLDVLKESAQSGWAKTWEIAFGDLEQAKAFWTPLSEKFTSALGKSADRRNNILSGAFDSKWDQLTKKINEAGIATEDFEKTLIETAKEHGIAIDDMIKEHGSLAKVVEKGGIASKVIIDSIKKFVSEGGKSTKTTADMTSQLEKYQKVVDEVWLGRYGNVDTGRIEKLTAAGYDFWTVQQLVNRTVDGHRLTLEDLVAVQAEMSDEQLKNIGLTEEQVSTIRKLGEEAEKTGTPINELIESLSKPSGRELFIQSLYNIIDMFGKPLAALRDAWQETFTSNDMSNALYRFLEILNNVTGALVLSEENADYLKRTFKGLFAIIKIITTFTGGVFNTVLKVLGNLLGMVEVNILEVTAGIGDAIVAFQQWLDEHNFIIIGLTKLAEVIGTVIKNVVEWVKAFWELESTQKIVTNVKNACSNAISKIGDFFAEGGRRISEFVQRVGQMDGLSLDNIIAALKDFYESVIKYFFNIEPVINTVKKFFSKFVDWVKGAFGKVGDGVKNTANSVGDTFTNIRNKIGEFVSGAKNAIGGFIDFIKSIDVGDIAAILIGVGTIKTLLLFKDVLLMLKQPLQTIASLVDAYSEQIEAQAKKIRSQAILNYALAIGILAASVYALGQLDPGRLWSAVGAIAALGVIMVILTKIIGSVKGITPKHLSTLAATSKSMLAIAGSLLLLALALRVMEGLDVEDALGNIALLGALAMMLALTTRIMSSKKKEFTTSAMALVGMAIALKILGDVLWDIGEMSGESLVKAVPALLAMMLGLALVAAAARNVKMGAFLGMIGIAVAIRLLLGVVKEIARVDYSTLNKGIANLTKLFASMVVLAIGIRIAGENIGKAGFGLLSIAFALKIVVDVVKALGTMDSAILDRGMGAVKALMTIFAGIMIISKFAGANAVRAGAMLLLMSGAMMAMLIVIAVLKHMTPDGLVQALGVITIIGLVFAALIKSTEKAGKAVPVLIAIASVLMLLAGVVAALTIFDPVELGVATAALLLISGAMAILIEVSKSIASTKGWIKTLGVLLGMSLIIAALGGILGALSYMEVNLAINNAAALGILVSALATSCYILGKVDATTIGKALLATLAISGIMVIIGGILWGLQALEINASLNNVLGLSILIEALAAACLILGKVAYVGPDAMAAAVVMAGVMALLVLVMAEMQALNINVSLTQVLGLSTFIIALSAACILLGIAGKAGVAAFVGVGALLALIVGLGLVVVAIGALAPHIEPLINGGIAALCKMADGLSLFMIKMVPFIAGVLALSSGILAGIAIITGLILALAVTAVLDAVASLLGCSNPMIKLSEDLIPFGHAMVKFSNIVSGNIDEGTVNAAASAGKALAEMAAALPNSGGLLGAIFGENDMDKFAAQIVPFGEAMVNFSNVVKGKIDKESVEAAANAGKAIAEMASALPNSGGWAGEIFGENDLDDFSDKLESFGGAIVAFSDQVKGKVDKDTVQVAADAGAAIGEMAKNLPNSGGWVADIFGDNDLGDFSTKLTQFGEAIVGFSDKVSEKGINVTAVDDATKAGGKLSDMAKALPDSNGLWDMFSGGKTSLSDFSSQLVTFGVGLRLFSLAVAGINHDNVDKATKAGTALAAMAQAVPDSGKLFGWFGDSDLENFSDALPPFGKAIKAFSDEVKDMDAGKVEVASEAGKALAEMAATGSKVSEFFTSDLSGMPDSFKYFGRAITAFTNEVRSTNLANVEDAAAAGTQIANMCKKLPQDTQWISKLTGMSSDTTALSTFSADLVEFGKAIVSFSDSVSGKDGGNGINVTAINSASKALDSFVGMEGKIAPTISVLNMINGIVGLDKFGTALSDFGGAIVAFSNSVQTADGQNGINADAITATGTALKAIGDSYTNLTKTFGVLNQIAGWKAEDGFKSSMINLGEAIVGFSNAVTTSDGNSAVNADAITATGNALGAIGTVGENLKSTFEVMNYLASFSGSSANGATINGMQAFGETITAFGKAIVGFSEAVSGKDGVSAINSEAITATGTALKAFSGIKEDLTNTIEVLNGITSLTTMEQLGSTLAALGGAMVSFSNSVTGENAIDTTAIGNVKTAMGIMGDMNNSIPENLKMASFGDAINTFIVKLKSFATTLSSIDLDTLSTKVESVKNIGSDMTKLGSDGVQGFISAFTNSTASVEIAVGNMVKAATDEISDRKSDFEKAGGDSTDQFVKGLESKDKDIETAANSLVTTAANEIKLLTNYLKFSSAGQYMVDGFIAGINSKITSAATAAANMASAAEIAAREELDINSPSKVFEEVGEGVPEGFINGIGSLGTGIKNAVSGMANVAVNTATSSMSRVASAFNGGFDFEPTIRPVMDMSSVSFNNVKLEADISTTLSRPVDSMAKIMADAQSEINASNQAVISSINGLREDLNAFCASTEKEVSLYVDSKRLASSIAKPMNQQLNILSRRGAY